MTRRKRNMPKQPTAYYRPKELTEALNLLAQPDMFPLAGGTKLLTGDVAGAVVDLQALALDQIQLADDRLRLGATLTLDALAAWLGENGAEGSPAEMLQTAVRQSGPNTYRHTATLGGSVASRLPDSELLAALLLLEATLHLASGDLPLADYLAAAERPSGLITGVSVQWENGRFAHARVARTPADDPIVAVLAWRPDGGAVRLAACGAAPCPTRLTAAETVADSEAAAQAAQAACTHPGDFRGDAAYRGEVTAVLTRRVLAEIN
jgi:CO/xanthine dehydrogenase FAD-binding subunit